MTPRRCSQRARAAAGPGAETAHGLRRPHTACADHVISPPRFERIQLARRLAIAVGLANLFAGILVRRDIGS
jgi:hypothetical protein